jgi:hypothetical protein
MISLLSLFIRLTFLAVFTFLFVVLFEHGPENYLANVREDFAHLKDSLATATSPAGKKLPTAGLDETARDR